MKKKLFSNIFILLYPLVLLSGICCHQLALEEAARTFQPPFALLPALYFIYFLLLAAFAFCFLVKDSACHLSVILIGSAELLLFLFPQAFSLISEAMYQALLGKQLVFGTMLTLYLVLWLKRTLPGTQHRP